MYIKVIKSKTAKLSRVYLCEAYRDENKKPKYRTLKCYGNLEELVLQDPNILEKLKLEAKSSEKNYSQIQVNFLERNQNQEIDKNYGYFFLENIYEQLGLSDYLNTNIKKSTSTNDLNEILKLLVFSRILNPMSKQETFEQRESFFKPFNVSLPSIYRGLSELCKLKDDLQYCTHKAICSHYERECSLVFYDVTNYYFETDAEDDFKKIGVSKENKKSPIVQMGLFIDSKGIPISYQLFPGNTSDTKTLIPIVAEMRRKFGMGRIILTADKGLNSGGNLKFLKENGDGYIVSQKIRGAGKPFVEQILDEEGYAYNESRTFKIKSFLRTRVVKDENESYELTEKVICFWSQDYETREVYKREILEEKLQSFLDNPGKYKTSNSFGLKKYLKVNQINTQTGELERQNIHLEFDIEKYEKDKKLDGYYAIVTSELELSEEEVIQKYRGLWKIEESFKVLKSDLEGRPVFVRKQDSIEGHFLVCFIALLILRILELRLKGKYSISKIQKSLVKATCRSVDKGVYSLNAQDGVFRDLEQEFNISFDKRFVKIEELRKLHKELAKLPTKNLT